MSGFLKYLYLFQYPHMGGILKGFGAVNAESHKLFSRINVAGERVTVGSVFVKTLKADTAVIAVHSYVGKHVTCNAKTLVLGNGTPSAVVNVVRTCQTVILSAVHHSAVLLVEGYGLLYQFLLFCREGGGVKLVSVRAGEGNGKSGHKGSDVSRLMVGGSGNVCRHSRHRVNQRGAVLYL